MNPYSYIARAIHCARANGIAEVFKIPARILATPIVIRLLGRRLFQFDGADLPYFYHRYNITWCNERCVEVPIARRYLADHSSRSVLEVGNVLSHYGFIGHPVVDKFEKGLGVLNLDILDVDPRPRYDLIISVSTFEHIGFDDDVKDGSGERILDAISHCRKMLLPGGKLVITAAAGYNPAFDMVVTGHHALDGKLSFMRRTGYFKWEECDVGHFINACYNHPYPFGNCIVVAEFGNVPA